jgi:hypothetical protein
MSTAAASSKPKRKSVADLDDDGVVTHDEVLAVHRMQMMEQKVQHLVVKDVAAGKRYTAWQEKARSGGGVLCVCVLCVVYVFVFVSVLPFVFP